MADIFNTTYYVPFRVGVGVSKLHAGSEPNLEHVNRQKKRKRKYFEASHQTTNNVILRSGQDFTCGEQLLFLWRDRGDGISLLDRQNAVFPATERLSLQLQRVRTAKPQQQRSGSVLFPLGQGELSGPSTRRARGPVLLPADERGRNGSLGGVENSKLKTQNSWCFSLGRWLDRSCLASGGITVLLALNQRRSQRLTPDLCL